MDFSFCNELERYFISRQQAGRSFLPLWAVKLLYKVYKYFYKRRNGYFLSEEQKSYLKNVKSSLDLLVLPAEGMSMADFWSEKNEGFFRKLKTACWRKIKKHQNIKLFCLYHYNDSFPVFRSDIYEPLQTGCDNMDFRFDCLGDHKGDNISAKNEHYAELTGHYWVWKNWLPKNKKYDYVGFVHHYRHFDFVGKQEEKHVFAPLPLSSFKQMFMKYNSESLFLDGADVYVPKELDLGESCFEQYCRYHPRKFYEKFEEIMGRKYPQYVPYLYVLRQRNKGYFCNMFIMRPKLLKIYESWLFDILFELEKEVDYEHETIAWDSLKRFPAFMSERFFNVWLCYQMQQKGIVVRELNTYKLTQEEKTEV